MPIAAIILALLLGVAAINASDGLRDYWKAKAAPECTQPKQP